MFNGHKVSFGEDEEVLEMDVSTSVNFVFSTLKWLKSAHEKDWNLLLELDIQETQK